jgi:predicted DNA binding protein
MSVIVELTLPSEAFELGQILRVEGPTQVFLETMVPLGGRPTPFVRVRKEVRESFEESVRDHPDVDDIESVTSQGAETLYRLVWDPPDETLFGTLQDVDAALLEATGGAERWEIEARFPSHEALSAFQEHYTDEDVPLTVDRIYNPVDPDGDARYGLTSPQREALILAVREGYYSVPRKVSTKGLAGEFGISDQAVTERLRRGITTLVESTLLTVGGES